MPHLPDPTPPATSASNAPGPALPISPGLFQRYVVGPILDLLRVGCTPRRLAWSIAVGFVVGINPLLGSTTAVSLLATFALRLNFVASQLAAHLSYPLEIALFFVFIRIGNRIYHTGHLPLHRGALLFAVRHHPWETTKLLWTWEWHALTVWAAAGLILAPLIALLLTPILTRLNTRLRPAGSQPAIN